MIYIIANGPSARSRPRRGQFHQGCLASKIAIALKSMTTLVCPSALSENAFREHMRHQKAGPKAPCRYCCRWAAPTPMPVMLTWHSPPVAPSHMANDYKIVPAMPGGGGGMDY